MRKWTPRSRIVWPPRSEAAVSVTQRSEKMVSFLASNRPVSITATKASVQQVSRPSHPPFSLENTSQLVPSSVRKDTSLSFWGYSEHTAPLESCTSKVGADWPLHHFLWRQVLFSMWPSPSAQDLALLPCTEGKTLYQPFISLRILLLSPDMLCFTNLFLSCSLKTNQNFRGRFRQSWTLIAALTPNPHAPANKETRGIRKHISSEMCSTITLIVGLRSIPFSMSYSTKHINTVCQHIYWCRLNIVGWYC